MTITEFINLVEPEKYDFTDDCISDETYKTKTGLDKFFEYRTNNKKNKDPDGSSALLQEIYRFVWKELVLQSNDFIYANNRIASDTMTSAWVPIKSYILKNYKDELNELKREKGYGRITDKLCKELYDTNTIVREQMNKNEQLVRFVSLYHSIGNYCPVPAGFNVPRSGLYASHDSWDLTLIKIREFYLADSNEYTPEYMMRIQELLHYDKTIINVHKWLKYFGNREDGWKHFIDTMKFKMYVKDDDSVFPLCNNHSWENTNIDDFDDFFEKVSDRIEKRGNEIVEYLRTVVK